MNKVQKKRGVTILALVITIIINRTSKSRTI